MMSIVEFGGQLFSFCLSITFMAAIVVAVFACVCNPKSKRFRKHKSFILPHNLPSEVPTTNADLNINHLEGDLQMQGTPNHLKTVTLHRALPDIPQIGSNDRNVIENPFAVSAGSAFAEVNANDDLDSLYNNVAPNAVDCNNENHPYARIRNQVPGDDSTENDTNDYSEARANQPLPVQIQCSHNDAQAAAVADIDQYELPSEPHILRLQVRNDIDSPIFNNNIVPAKKEISYNTISVREPLSKVLAEREDLEHHYNEVEEEERVSSFYEEITTGSNTYSKINELPIGHPNTQQEVGSSGQSTSKTVPRESIAEENSALNGALYSCVDKKAKRAYLQETENETGNSHNLYTKVFKSQNKQNGNDNGHVAKPVLQRYSPPPPLPPPIHKEAQHKTHRNTILFGTSSDLVDTNENIYHKISLSDSEKDPGYETVYKEVHPPDKTDGQPDYGYEAIMTDENDPAYEMLVLDPAYETIHNNQSNIDLYGIDEQTDPNYEIIPINNVSMIMVPGSSEPTPAVSASNATTTTTMLVPNTGNNYINNDPNISWQIRHNDNSPKIDENVIIEHL